MNSNNWIEGKGYIIQSVSSNLHHKYKDFFADKDFVQQNLT